MIFRDSFDIIFKGKNKILVVMAHPDDTELYAGGTVARLIESGKEVRVIKTTLGNKGNRQQKISEKELGEIRLKEDRSAMKVFGIKEENNIYLNFPDGGVEHNLESIGQVAKQIRLFKPELIITHNPEHKIIRFAKDVNWVNHRDHLNTGNIAIDAAYPYSRDLLFFPEHFQDKNVASHACTEFLLVDFYEHPDLVHIDVTDQLEIRIKAHASHSSQYSLQQAKDSADFFTKNYIPRRYECFRYVIAD